MIFEPVAGWTLYRMHTPKWAMAPTSGAGAAGSGGRANRVGVAALYLSLEAETAIAEYQQISPLLPPGTIVSYQIRANPVLDFRAGYVPNVWPPLWEGFFCDWRELWFNQHIEPPSWVLGDEAILTCSNATAQDRILQSAHANYPAMPAIIADGSFAQRGSRQASRSGD